MKDPAAAEGCRVWAVRPRCGHNDPHGAYMLATRGGDVFTQCTAPTCTYRWWHHTGFGSQPRDHQPLWWPTAP